MKWYQAKPSYGDIIRTKFNNFYHYGIYVDDNEVIQFGVAPDGRKVIKDSEVEVCITDFDYFSYSLPIEVCIFDERELAKKRSADQIVDIARTKLGQRGYNIIHNNCEHFVFDCALGVKYCSQTEEVRRHFKSLPLVHLYFAELPLNEDYKTLYPKERNSEISKTTHALTKRQRYYVWKLLEYSLNRSLGLVFDELEFTKLDSGKWVCDKCYFSLSHSENGLLVGVSRKPIGVDIERMHNSNVNSLYKKILTDKELDEYTDLSEENRPDYLVKAWTIKESVFKMSDEKSFSPRKISNEGITSTGVITLQNDEYAYSVSSEDVAYLKTYRIDKSKLL